MMAGLLFAACQKEDDNGDLGGFWKLLKVEEVQTGRVIDTKDDDCFWSIQLDLLAVGGAYGRFQHVGDSLFVQMIYVPQNAASYGLYNPKDERFFTDLMYWDQEKELIYSDAYIKIEQEDQVTEGVGFSSNQSMTVWEIKNTKGIYAIKEEE